MRKFKQSTLLICFFLAAPAFSASMNTPGQTDGDPYESMVWPTLKKEYLGANKVQFDNRVIVSGPEFADDAMSVPIEFDASALENEGGGIRNIVVMVDRNPIRRVLTFEPLHVKPKLSFRFKLEQASPVRVAVQTKDNVWHVGGTLVDASGGGCTVAGATRSDGSWSRTLNDVSTRYFLSQNGDNVRLRARIMHPMDTGLVSGIPSFHIETLELIDQKNEVWLRLNTFEPVSENPLFSFDLPGNSPVNALRLVGRDNNGNLINSNKK